MPINSKFENGLLRSLSAQINKGILTFSAASLTTSAIFMTPLSADSTCPTAIIEISNDYLSEIDIYNISPESESELLCGIVTGTSAQISSLLKIPVNFKPSVSVLTSKEFQSETGAPSWSQGIFIDGVIYVSGSRIKSMDQEFRLMIKHETFHAFIYNISAFELPAWLEEGLAQLISGETKEQGKRFYKPGRSRPKLKNLRSDFHKLPKHLVLDAYDYSLLAARHLVALKGFEKVGEYLLKITNGYSSDEAFIETFEMTESELEKSIKTSSLDRSNEPKRASENSRLSKGLRSPTPSPTPK